MGRKDMGGFSPVKHRPRVLQIKKIVEETPTIKSFYVDCPDIASASEPGQFVMLWVIGVDEVPMSVSWVVEGRILGLTVEKVGDATSRLHELREGDLIGVRGPYGRGFDLSSQELLMVGGGCGVSPIAFAAKRALSMKRDVAVVLAAKTADELLFRSRLEKLDINLFTVTEDGSAGMMGIASKGVEKVLSKNKKFDSCFVCGPEPMMVDVAELVRKSDISVQVSLDRYIKCGVGLCGQCCLDPSGVRVCCEGPVFSYEKIKDGEFGEYRRDAAGVKREF